MQCQAIMIGAFNAKKLATWHAIVHTYGAMIVIIMDMWQWTAQTRYHHQVCHPITDLTTGTGIGDPPLGNPVTPGICAMTTGTGSDSATLNPILITTVIGAIANMNTAGTIQDSSIDLPVAAPHVIGAPVHIATTETLPTADLLTIIPPEMTADLDITPNTANTNQPKDHQQQHRHHPRNMKTGNRKENKSSLMIHHQNITVQKKVKATQRMI